jgi:PST family polysaccharide transporter
MASPSDSHNDAPLYGRVARGAAWMLAAGLGARLLGALNTIVVARLLAPDDIGLVAVATIAMQLLQGLSDIGISQAVVRFRDADRDDLNTLFTLSLARGLVVAALLAASAPLAAAFYDDPRMTAVFFGVAAFPVILGLVNPRFYEFERELRFSREFIVAILTKLAGVIVSVSIALIFRNYWAIILGLLAGGAMQLVLSYATRPFRPRLSAKSFGKFFGFSGWLAGVSFVAALNNKLDVPILARMLGAGGAGVYFMGFQLSELVAGQLATPLTRAIYPGLALIQDETDRVRVAFLRGVEALGVIAMPAAVGLAFIAEDLVLLLLGEKWRAAIPVIQILAPVIGVQSLFAATQGYAVALGRPGVVFFRELIFLIVRLPLFVWAVVLYGMTGAVWAAAGAGLMHIGLNLALYAHISKGPFWEPVWSARRSIFGVVIMSVYFLAFSDAVELAFGHTPLIFQVAGAVLAGAALYGAGLIVLWFIEGRPSGVESRMLRMAEEWLSRAKVERS